MNLLAVVGSVAGLGGIGAAIAFIPGAAAIVGKAVDGAISFFSEIPWAKVWWLIPIAAALAFGLYKDFKYRAIEKEIPALQADFTKERLAFQAEQRAFRVEQTSLNGARGAIDDNNKRIAAQAADLIQAKKNDAAARARNDKAARSTDAKIAALQAAATHHTVPCTLSSATSKELENQ